MPDEKHLTRLAKLLRQAEKAATEAEAAAFMQKAQELSTLHAIDLEVARQHQVDKDKRETPTHERIRLGEKGKRGLHTYVELFSQIAGANDVQINVAYNSTYVIAFGFPSDIDVVKALYESLVTQMVEASTAYLRSPEYKTAIVRRWVRGRYKHDPETGRNEWHDGHETYGPVHPQTARISFQEAFAYKVGARLSEARQAAIETAEATRRETMSPVEQDEQAGVSTELVLVSKAVEVSDYYKRTSDARGSYRGGRGGARNASAQLAGREAGARARLGGERAITTGQRQLS